MTRKIRFWTGVILIAIVLAGCGSGEKTENTKPSRQEELLKKFSTLGVIWDAESSDLVSLPDTDVFMDLRMLQDEINNCAVRTGKTFGISAQDLVNLYRENDENAEKEFETFFHSVMADPDGDIEDYYAFCRTVSQVYQELSSEKFQGKDDISSMTSEEIKDLAEWGIQNIDHDRIRKLIDGSGRETDIRYYQYLNSLGLISNTEKEEAFSRKQDMLDKFSVLGVVLQKEKPVTDDLRYMREERCSHWASDTAEIRKGVTISLFGLQNHINAYEIVTGQTLGISAEDIAACYSSPDPLVQEKFTALYNWSVTTSTSEASYYYYCLSVYAIYRNSTGQRYNGRYREDLTADDLRELAEWGMEHIDYKVIRSMEDDSFSEKNSDIYPDYYSFLEDMGLLNP